MVEHYPDELRPEDYRARAAERARSNVGGIGVAVERDVSARAERGRAWECVVSDGERHAHVRAEAPDLGAGQAILPELVETAIERRAEDAGFDGVVAQAPIVLGPAELTTA